MKNNIKKINIVALFIAIVFICTIKSNNLVAAQDLLAIPPVPEMPAAIPMPMAPVEVPPVVGQPEVPSQQAKPKEDKKTETKIDESELDDEQVFDEDKEAYVEDNRRVYPKWQSSRKKPVNDYEYSIKVNKTTNTVTVYIKEDDGKLTPYKAMVCSIGRAGHETPEGKGYHTSDYYDWRLMVDNTYGRYAVRFNGSIMFHSVPYYKSKKNTLEWKDYNKLGGPASLGCIRLAVADAKWIFDNCKRGTEVEVYSGPASTDPMGTPTPIRLDTTSEYRDWDPTDLTIENPWLETIE